MRSGGPLLLLPLLAAPLHGRNGWAHARLAQALLGPGGWSRVVRIEVAGPAPRTEYALVFELEHALWFYAWDSGTQSLSEYWGRTARDERDLGPLLRGIDARYGRWEFAPGEAPGALPERLTEGCFIESLALLRRRLQEGRATPDPRLLSYYVETSGGLKGHTVLQFSVPGGVGIIDPNRPNRVERVRVPHPRLARDIAGRLRPDISAARWLPVADWANGQTGVGR